jgi:hypothetical protein
MAHRPENWRQIARQDAARMRTNPINGGRPAGRAPFVDELLASPLVQRAFAEAWRDTNADDTIHGNPHASEQGGWIYMALGNGSLSIRRARHHTVSSIRLDPPDIVAGSVIVATFHTHPGSPFTGASDFDRQLSIQQGVPGFVLGRSGQLDIVGPERRAGDWSRAPLEPGFPP